VCPYINTKEKQKKKREQGKAAGQACKGHLRSTGCGGKFLLLGRKVAHVLATTDTCLLIAVQQAAVLFPRITAQVASHPQSSS
jgi:hypothetical protein